MNVGQTRGKDCNWQPELTGQADVEEEQQQREYSNEHQQPPQQTRYSEDKSAGTAVQRETDALIKKPRRWTDYRSWQAIPGLNLSDEDFTWLKEEVSHIRNAKLKEGVTWKRQDPADIEAFRKAVQTSCGALLARYENCWPAEAVSREGLISRKGYMKNNYQLNLKVSRRRRKQPKDQTGRDGNGKDDNDLDDDHDDHNSTAKMQVSKTCDDTRQIESSAEGSSVGEESSRPHKCKRPVPAAIISAKYPKERPRNKDDVATSEKDSSKAKRGRSKKRQHEEVSDEAGADEGKRTSKKTKLAEGILDIAEVIDDEDLVYALRRGGINNTKNLKRIAAWDKAFLREWFEDRDFTPFQVGDMMQRLRDIKKMS
ncbi:hypothetical protein EIP86_000972 [Pleurotus ostreatoroseus]|nr:hypothetical protein EIP86_000972 [Pleurotus ostreatoroseus]